MRSPASRVSLKCFSEDFVERVPVSRALAVIPKPVSPEASEAPVVREVPVKPSMGSDRIRATPTAPPRERVAARPVMAQSASSPTPVPSPAAPVAAVDKISISLTEARGILAGLQATIGLADNANKTGWKCSGVSDAVFYQGRVLRDRLSQYAATAREGSSFEITKDEIDAADKILGCSNEATEANANTGAYVALGVIVAGAAIFLSMA